MGGRDIPGRPLRRFIVATLVAAAVVVCATAFWLGAPLRPSELLVLVALAVVSRIGPRNEVGSSITFSIVSVVQLTSIPICGPVGAAVVGGVATLSTFRRVPRRALVFNLGMHMLLGGLGALGYALAGGSFDLQGLGRGQLVVSVVIPLLVADVVLCVANAAMVGAVSHYWSGSPFRTHVATLLEGTGAAYMAYGVLAVLLVILWLPAQVGPFSVALILAPLFVIRWAATQYGGEVLAHERTLNSIVAAIDETIPGAAARSELTGEAAAWIAEELTSSPKDIELCRLSGRLYEADALGQPVLGSEAPGAARLLEGISFLDLALPGIVHHEERFDGSGRPDGLTGEAIPLPARVVAVASAFAVALLDPAAGAYVRPDPVAAALASVQAGSGSRFDPAVVAALEAVVPRHRTGAAMTAAVVARMQATGEAQPLNAPAFGGGV